MADRHFWTIVDNKIAKGSIRFKWEAGTSIAQKKRCCRNLHNVIDFHCELSPLDISRGSTSSLGESLSAFNLTWKGKPVECWYQGSKVFSNAGAMHKLYNVNAATAKNAVKASGLGRLVGFNLDGAEFPMEPKTAFYDLLYLCALREKFGDSLELSAYDCFTDIMATTDTLACQARTVCEYKLLQNTANLDVLNNFDEYIQWHKEHVESYYPVVYKDCCVLFVSDGIIKCIDTYVDTARNNFAAQGINMEHLGYSKYKLTRVGL